MARQPIRSVTNWSSELLENTYYAAYVDIIEKSEHFIYLGQQFFATATGTWHGTVWNQVGKALIWGILRRSQGEKRYKIIATTP